MDLIRVDFNPYEYIIVDAPSCYGLMVMDNGHVTKQRLYTVRTTMNYDIKTSAISVCPYA